MEMAAEDPWAVPPSCFPYANESDQRAFEAYMAKRIQQIRDGIAPIKIVITMEQLEEMARGGSGFPARYHRP
jgi:hypothetical protein